MLGQAAEARSEAGKVHADLVRVLEEASRLEEQSLQARVEAERARTEAEEDTRVALEARRIAEEKARMEEEARRKVLFNTLSFFVFMPFFLKKKFKQESISVGCIMPTCHLYVLLWPSDVSPMNKFEQVSSNGHQMSLAGGWGKGLRGHMSYVQRGRARGWARKRARGPCTVRTHIPLWTDRHN